MQFSLVVPVFSVSARYRDFALLGVVPAGGRLYASDASQQGSRHLRVSPASRDRPTFDPGSGVLPDWGFAGSLASRQRLDGASWIRSP